MDYFELKSAESLQNITGQTISSDSAVNNRTVHPYVYSGGIRSQTSQTNVYALSAIQYKYQRTINPPQIAPRRSSIYDVFSRTHSTTALQSFKVVLEVLSLKVNYLF